MTCSERLSCDHRGTTRRQKQWDRGALHSSFLFCLALRAASG
jgi:hypothetical protein